MTLTPPQFRLAAFLLPIVSLAWPGLAHADWRAETGVLRIGVVASPSAPQSAEPYEPFGAAVAEAIDMPAEIVVMRDAASLIDAHAGGRIDYAILSAMGFAAAHVMCACVEPLAAPRSAEEATGVRTVLIADGERVDDMADLSGLSVAWGPRGSLTGDLVPNVALADDQADLAGVTLMQTAADSFQAARRAFLAGEVAALFAWDYADGDDGAFENGLGARIAAEATTSVKTVWRSRPIPFGPHTVHDTVPDDIRDALTAMLVALNETRPDAYDTIAPSLSGGFAAVGVDDYAFAFDIARALAETE